jgi:REP element-mobilizing transposase RayT
MPRRQVVLQAGNYYHVYNRGNNRQLIFLERENYLYFLRQLQARLISKGVDIVAYCLMPNHYHLLVYLQTDDFSKLMQAFALCYTKAINKRHHQKGSLFQGPFNAIRVNSDEYLATLTRYIHLNPVRANLVEKAEEWEFSSYQEYIKLRQSNLLSLNEMRSLLDTTEDYRSFVEDATISDKPIQHLTFED